MLASPRRTPSLACVLVASLVVGCGRPSPDAHSPAGARSATPPPTDDGWIGGPAVDPAPPPPASPPAPPSPSGHDFAAEVRLLYRVAACADDGPLPPGLDPTVVAAHCAEIRPKIAAYKARYVGVARPFLTALLPPGLPDRVVYPFGGGDLVTALTTYPAAREITTLSLELVGDPRRIHGLSRAALERSLRQLRAELAELVVVDDYSRSETLKKTQRGDIPGELGLFLVGLAVHGFEPVSLRYFTLSPEGEVHYLSEQEIATADGDLARSRKATWTPPDFSEAFANAELGFRPVGGGELRVHRHLAQNLADEHFARSPAERHLAAKGPVAAMTKAASYLLWRDAFSTVRRYLLDHLVIMVSDSTGLPPSLCRAAGLVQETYGSYRGALLRADPRVDRDFRSLWRAQPARPLPFRYGYLSAKQPHLVITKRPPTVTPPP